MNRRGPGWWLAVAAAVAMALVAASGLWILGTPAHQRALRMDARRVQDLRMLTNHIAIYWRRNSILPPDLTHLNANPVLLRDPQTDTPYTYRVTGETGYQLCARFQEPTPDAAGGREPLPSRILANDDSWRHPSGRYCFDRNVKP